jgi:SNF2 family DNA or RNA helicase
MNSTALKDSQIEAKKHLEKWKVGALFMEMGTGKTRTAMELIEQVDYSDLFWVCPLRTIENVKQEIEKWGGLRNVHFFGIESISMSDRVYLELFNKATNSRKPFLVMDESIKIKNHDSKRTQRMLEIAKYVEYKLVLNGSPITRNLLDLWAQLYFLSPEILKMDMAEFKNTFCKYTTITKRIGKTKVYTKEFITGYENIDYLYSLIHHYIFEADLTLSIKKNYHQIRYVVSDKKEYTVLKEKYLNDEMLQFKNNNIFLEMTSKMQHSYCVDVSKIEAFKQLIKDLDQSKVLVFCRFVKSQEVLKEMFPELQILSYQKHALGLNLQQYNTTIYFDKVWDYGLRTQSINRTYRIGQNQNCNYYDLTGDVGLEALIDKNIAKKIGIVEYFKSKTKEQLKEVL